MESLDAVVDHGGDDDHGDGEYRHPDQDGPDATDTIVGDSANHEDDFGVNALVRQPALRGAVGRAEPSVGVTAE